MAKTKPLPKGITPVKYYTKDKEVTKWRVRINKKIDGKEFKLNKLFDDLDVAIEAVNNSKTIVGRDTIVRVLTKQEKEKSYAEIMQTNDLRMNLNIYYKKHYFKNSEDEIEQQNNKTYANIIKSILNTKIPDFQSWDFLPPAMKASLSPAPKKIGDFDVFSLQARDITSYIEARINAGKAKSTVTKEVGILSSFFNNYHSYMGDNYLPLREKNPCSTANKNKISDPYIKRKRRLSEQEELQLEASLSICRNPQMVQIVALAIYTGMRRSEIIHLKWSQIKDGYIDITKQKNKRVREVPIFPEITTVLNSIQKVKGRDRLFTYTIEGFKSNWARAVDRAKLKDFTFHDLRSEFISRLLEKGLGSYVVAEVANISNQSYFEATHVKNFEDEQRRTKTNYDEKDVRAIVGHETKNMTQHYFRLNFNRTPRPKEPIKE